MSSNALLNTFNPEEASPKSLQELNRLFETTSQSYSPLMQILQAMSGTVVTLTLERRGETKRGQEPYIFNLSGIDKIDARAILTNLPPLISHLFKNSNVANMGLQGHEPTGVGIQVAASYEPAVSGEVTFPQ